MLYGPLQQFISHRKRCSTFNGRGISWQCDLLLGLSGAGTRSKQISCREGHKTESYTYLIREEKYAVHIFVDRDVAYIRAETIKTKKTQKGNDKTTWIGRRRQHNVQTKVILIIKIQTNNNAIFPQGWADTLDRHTAFLPYHLSVILTVDTIRPQYLIHLMPQVSGATYLFTYSKFFTHLCTPLCSLHVRTIYRYKYSSSTLLYSVFRQLNWRYVKGNSICKEMKELDFTKKSSPKTISTQTNNYGITRPKLTPSVWLSLCTLLDAHL